MLVISRKVDESLWIGDTKVTVLRMINDKVRLGIEAPQVVKVVRAELLERKQADTQSKPQGMEQAEAVAGECAAWGCTAKATHGDYCDKHKE